MEQFKPSNIFHLAKSRGIMPKKIPTILAGDLKERLEPVPDDWEISFSGLEFSRFKVRGEKLIQIEFNEAVFLDDEGRVVVHNLD